MPSLEIQPNIVRGDLNITRRTTSAIGSFICNHWTMHIISKKPAYSATERILFLSHSLYLLWCKFAHNVHGLNLFVKHIFTLLRFFTSALFWKMLTPLFPIHKIENMDIPGLHFRKIINVEIWNLVCSSSIHKIRWKEIPCWMPEDLSCAHRFPQNCRKL